MCLDLEKGVEDGVLHELNVAHVRWYGPTSDEVLPADDGREKDNSWNKPRETNRSQHLYNTHSM